MARWEPDSRGRLAAAALELFSERGFEATTVADIAGRAGLTERTFFRHFADKREILFGGAAELQELMVAAIASSPPSAGPLEAVTRSLGSAAGLLGQRHDFARQRYAIIAATPELQERELIKLASLAAAMTEALRARGVTPTAAGLIAEMGIAVFRISFDLWVETGNERAFPDLIADTFEEFQGLALGDRATI
ncbi:MAG TPA: TetR family transcriptional regulator [Acidimicrobiales bacterium]|jgi:AcrR family transcriptional regulator